MVTTLGKDFFIFIFKLFAECPLSGTRQSLNFFLKKILCRVPSGRHSAKFEFFLKKNSLHRHDESASKH